MVSLIITLLNSIHCEEISGKWVKTSKAAKSNNISSITSAELTKLKRLIRFHNKPRVLLYWILGEKPPEPVSQPPPPEMMKQWQQISKWKGCGTLFDKTDKKLYIFGGSGFNWYGKCAATNKNYKIGQRKTYYCAKTVSIRS